MQYSIQYLDNRQTSIQTIHLKEDGLYAFDDKSNLIRFDAHLKILWKIPVDTQHYLLGNNENLLITYRQFNSIHKIQNGNVSSSNISCKPIGLNNQRIEVAFHENQTFYFSKLDLEFNETMIRINCGDFIPIYYNDEGYVIGQKNGIFNSISTSNGKLQWQLDLLDMAAINGAEIINIHFFENKLVAVIGSRREAKTFVIDMNNGKILHEQFGFGGYTYLYAGKLWVAYNDKIHNLDLTTYTLQSHIITDEQFIEKNFFIQHARSFFANNKLYFNACSGKTEMDSYVGILNLENFELEWYYEILKNPKKASTNENRSMVIQIKATENQLYVLVAGGVLHVFEKTE